jgi:hypothetical protein
LRNVAREFGFHRRDRARRRRPELDHLLRSGRFEPQLLPRQRVNPLRICECGLFQAELMVLLLQNNLLRLEVFDLIAVPQASEMLPRTKKANQKNQKAQSEQTETFMAFLRIHFPAKPGVVNSLHEIDFGIRSAPRNGLIPRPPVRLGQCCRYRGHSKSLRNPESKPGVVGWGPEF